MTGSSGPCPASFAPNGQLGSGSSISTVSTSGMSSEVRLLYSRSDGILCTSALESLGGSLRKTCSSISASDRPMYTLPSTCPRASTGLMVRPISCAIQIFGTVIQPVFGSTSASTGQARRLVRADGSERAELLLGEADRLREAQASVLEKYLAVGEREPVRRHFELLCSRSRDQVFQLLRGLNGCVAHHHGHPARVGAEVDRRDAGISGHAAHVEGIDTQDFRHDGDEHVVGALPDLGSAAEHGDLAAAVEQQLHAALRHLVPVDRQPGAAEVRAAGQAYAAAVRKLLELAFPIRACGHLLDALRQT